VALQVRSEEALYAENDKAELRQNLSGSKPRRASKETLQSLLWSEDENLEVTVLTN
jgi:hypothetical protein